MLSQIAAGFRLQQGHQVTDLDEELRFGPFLGRKHAGVALDSELLEAAARHFVALQRHDLLCGSRRQTSAQGRNNPTQQLRGSAFVRIMALYPIPETLANRAGEIIVKSNPGTRKGQAGVRSCGKC